MKEKLYTFRPAVAMIELIFALVVMGIVMMSAPQLISTAGKSSYVAIQQEGINEAATQMSIMMDYAWDENDTNASHATVLNVSNGDPELDGTKFSPGGLKKRRAGTPELSYRLYKSYDGTEYNASAIGFDVGELTEDDIDDIDDFNGTSVNLSGVTTAKDYIEKGVNINISRTVSYMSDNALKYATGGVVGGTLSYTPNFNNATPTTNIKRLQVTLTSTSGVNELVKTITLHAFSCNIGTYKLKEK